MMDRRRFLLTSVAGVEGRENGGGVSLRPDPTSLKFLSLTKVARPSNNGKARRKRESTSFPKIRLRRSLERAPAVGEIDVTTSG
jgi:hypothetical protein